LLLLSLFSWLFIQPFVKIMEEEDSYDSAEEIVTVEEKHLIARHFIGKSPANEGPAIAKDLNKLIGNDINEQNLNEFLAHRAVKWSDFIQGSDVIFCSQSKQEDGSFVDPFSGEQIKVDFLTNKILEKGEVKPNADEFRAELAKEVRKYVDLQFCKEEHASRRSAVFGEDGAYEIIITAKNVNLNNFWTGSWCTKYTYNTNNNTLQSETNVNVHYFEKGNVQLNTTHKAELEVTKKGATGIVEAMQEIEDEFQQGLQDFFLNNKSTFKTVRRALPIHGKKMNWNVNVHNMVDGMKK